MVLTPRLRVLVTASVHLGAGHEVGLRGAFADALQEDLGPEMEEVLLQGHLLLGYPRALGAMATWRALSGAHSAPPSVNDLDLWAERGARVCRDVYGSAYEKLRKQIREIHPELERWMVAEYGKVLARPGLALVERELTIAATLIGLGAPEQLFSHLRGALNVGAPATVVDATVEHAGALVDDERSETARSVWGQVRARTGASVLEREPSEGDH